MDYESGFIKLYRKFTKWEWYDDEKTKTVFLHLLLTANWEDRKWHGVEIKRGQLICSRKALAKTLGITEQSVRTALEHLKSTNEITTKSTNKGTLITLANYEKYQGSDFISTNEQTNKSTDCQPTSNQRVTTTKEYKEYKELKEIKNTSMHSIIDAWNELEDFGIVKIVSLTPGTKRYEMTQARVKQYGEEEVIRAIRKVKNSKFLQGSTFFKYDWFIAPNNFIKVLEGNYDNKGEAKAEPKKEIFPEEDYNPNIKRW